MNNEKSWYSWKSEVRRRNRMIVLKRQLFAEAVNIGYWDDEQDSEFVELNRNRPRLPKVCFDVKRVADSLNRV